MLTEKEMKLINYIRSMASCGRPNRTHEECSECVLRECDPPQCLGHYAGPSCCPMFIGEEKKRG